MAGGKVTGSDASMREKPSLDASVTATLPKGGTVDIIRTSDDKEWLMVSGVSTKGDLEVGWV